MTHSVFGRFADLLYATVGQPDGLPLEGLRLLDDSRVPEYRPAETATEPAR